MPTARTGLAVATGADGLIYAMGGFNGMLGYSPVPTVEAYDPASNVWTTRAGIGPRQDLAAAAGMDGHIYAIGGRNGTGEIALVEVYDFASNTWTGQTNMPAGYRTSLAAVGLNGRIYAVGGYTNGGSELATVEAYDPKGNTWTTPASMPTPRSGLSVAVARDGRMYAIGGSNRNLATMNPYDPNLTTVEAYDPASNTWTPRASMPTARSSLAAVAGSDGRIYAIGGIASAAGSSIGVATVEAYDPASNTWTTRASMPTARGYLAAAAGADGRIYVIGGGSGGLPLATVQAYDPKTDTWFQ